MTKKPAAAASRRASLPQKQQNRHRSELAELVRNHRKEKGMSLEQLARLTNLSRSYLGDIEAGRKGSNLSNYTITELSRALGIEARLLFPKISNDGTLSEAQQYGEHYRVLRSNVRAHRMARLLARIRADAQAARTAILHGKDATKLLQSIEIVVEAIDKTLTYRRKPPVSVHPTADAGDDDKFFDLGRSG